MDREKLESFAKIWVIGLVVFWIATMISGFKYRPDVEKAEKFDSMKEELHYLLDNYQGALPKMASMDTQANDAYEITYLFTLDLQEILDDYK